MNVLGLDLSLTATGVCVDGGAHTIRIPLPEHATEYQRVHRLHTLVVQIDRLIKTADLVVVENYGYHGKHSPGHSLGELGGAVRLVLYKREIPFVVVEPQRMKQFICGKGNASKDDILIAAAHRAPFRVNTRDEADAWGLWSMGRAHLGLPFSRHPTPLTKMQRQVVAAITWPRLNEREESVV